MGVTLGLVSALVVALFYLGAFAYLGVTFVTMRGYADPRPLRITLRSFLFELLCVVIAQPFLPFFYLVGRRLGGARDGVPVVFVHGYFQNRVDFVYLARVFARRGLGPLYGINYPFLASVKDNAARLRRFCDQVREETGKPELDLVCHSMGGLVAFEMIREGARGVRRCVTIASPHAGVVFRGPILGASGRDMRKGSALLREHEAAKAGVPVLSIFSSHDNVVHPKLTSALAARGGEDVEVSHFGHFGILFSSEVAGHVTSFLQREDERGARGTSTNAPATVQRVAVDSPEPAPELESAETEAAETEAAETEAAEHASSAS